MKSVKSAKTSFKQNMKSES